MFIKKLNKITAFALITSATLALMSNTALAMDETDENEQLSNSSAILEFEKSMEGVEIEEAPEVDTKAVIEDINMSIDDMETLYEEFLSQQPRVRTFNVNNSGYDDKPDFVNYAVENGKIPNTRMARDTFSKEAYRSDLRMLGNICKGIGLYYTGEFLLHSLQNKPSNKSYAASSNLASDIKQQSGYKDSKKYIKQDCISAEKKGKTTAYRSNSFGLTRTAGTQKAWDMYLAIHNTNYTANCTKKSGKWNLVMKTSDVYNFEYWNLKNYKGMTSKGVAIINNYAAAAQKIGAIVPYNVYVTINDTL